MPDEKAFQKRISFKGDLSVLLTKVCQDFDLGKYQSHKIITVGYEDLNIVTQTSKDTYLVKALADFRDNDDKRRYSNIIQEVNKAGVAHPKLYSSNQDFLHPISIDGLKVYLFVMQYIKGKSFYDLKTKPNKEELKFLTKQAALINRINLKPKYVYDSWAVVNFIKEYEKIKEHLNKEDLNLIKPLNKKFKEIDLDKLPHSFVHGDIIDTNVIKDENGNLWIIDFSVSNYYPRIQELAVLLCDLAFDQKKLDTFENNYDLVLAEYQKETKITKKEIEVLPTYLRAAHAMHIIGAMSDIVQNGDSQENQHWLKNGRKGLQFTSKLWN